MRLVEKIGIIALTVVVCVIGINIYNLGKDKTHHNKLFWSYYSSVVDSQNDYWQPEIIDETEEGLTIIRNNVTGEYFILITGGYGITLTPIETDTEAIIPDEDIETLRAGND